MIFINILTITSEWDMFQLGFVICTSVDLAQGHSSTQQAEQHAFYMQEAQIGPATEFLPS